MTKHRTVSLTVTLSHSVNVFGIERQTRKSNVRFVFTQKTRCDPHYNKYTEKNRSSRFPKKKYNEKGPGKLFRRTVWWCFS